MRAPGIANVVPRGRTPCCRHAWLWPCLPGKCLPGKPPSPSCCCLMPVQVYVLRKLALYGDRVVAVVGAGHLKGIT